MSAKRSVFSTLRIWVYDEARRLFGAQFVRAPMMVVANAGRALTNIAKLLMMEESMSGVLWRQRP